MVNSDSYSIFRAPIHHSQLTAPTIGAQLTTHPIIHSDNARQRAFVVSWKAIAKRIGITLNTIILIWKTQFQLYGRIILRNN